MKLIPLSKSTYATFVVCPFKANAHKNLGYPRQPTVLASRGKLVHHYREKISNSEMTLDQARSQITDPEVAMLVEKAVTEDPYSDYLDQLSEAHVKIDAEGNSVETDDEAAAYGYMDRVIFAESELVIDELKTGSMEFDDVFERHLYAGLLARAAQPVYSRIRFVRHFCRSGRRFEYLYEWKKRRDGTHSLKVTHPDGSVRTIRGRHSNPMVVYLQKILSRIDKTGPVARPGDHCRNWFGSPCQFYGNICPQSLKLPSLVSGSFNLASQQKAFLSFLRSQTPAEYLSLENTSAAMALDAVHQIDSGLKEVEKRIREWSHVNGHIQLRNELYGWEERQDPVIDKSQALRFLFDSGLGMDEIAKAVNISKSSIEKLPRSYQTLKDAALGMFQTVSKRRFGLIKKTGL